MGNTNSSKENDFLNIENKKHDMFFFSSLNNMGEEKKIKQLHDYSYFKDNTSYNGISSEFSSPSKKDRIKDTLKSFTFKDTDQTSTDEERFQHETSEKKENSRPESSNVRTLFEWKEGGENVYLTGSFVNWEQKILLKKNLVEQKFEICLELPKGRYEYKFVVDEIWKFSKFHPTTKDQRGNINNILDNSNYTSVISNTTITKNVNKEEKKSGKKTESSFKKLLKQKENENSNNNLNENKLLNYINSISNSLLTEIKKNKSKSKQKSNKEKEDYISNLPRKVELNTDAIACPDYYRDLYNINLSSRQTSLANSDCIVITDTVFGAGNTSFLSIAAPPHVNLNHVCTKKINNKTGVIVTSSTQRTDEKLLTIIYYRPVNLIKRKK